MNPLIINNNPDKNSPIIVALDYSSATDALNLVARLNPQMCKLKVGKELFTAAGPKFVEQLVVSGYDVFLDLKFHDIPNTVAKACKSAANLGIWMLTLHASGGQKMLEYAKEAISEFNRKPLLIGITVLTSMNETDLKQIGITNGIESHIQRLTQLSYQSGLDGITCSAIEASMVKQHTNANFITVTPGIRLPDSKADDQSRVMTPKAAIDNHADYLVIGRPITQAADPKSVLLDILSQIGH